VSHVLLPVSCLLRRADGAAVIWAALAASAAGAGHRKIAAALGRPASTVRSWLARFTSRAGLVRGLFTRWLCALDADPPPLPPAGSAAADAVAAVAAAARAAGRRWPALAGIVSPGALASSVSAGRLLSPSWAGAVQHQSGLGGGRRGRQGCGEQDQSPFCRVLEVADDCCR
jgi:hypothetical protein